MSTGLENIEIYYNIFDKTKKNNGKNPTNYVDMYDMPEFKNSLFIYTANETNSGPGNASYRGSGTAEVATKERAFGIITGCLYLHNCKTYGTTTTYKVTYKFDDKVKKYIKNKPIDTEQKTVLNHIADQVKMLGEFIAGWNADVAINDNKITNIILPLTQNTGGNLKLGVDIFKKYKEIDVIGDTWLTSVLILFNKTNNNLKPALNLLLNRNSLAGTSSAATFKFNPKVTEFIPKTTMVVASPGTAAIPAAEAAEIKPKQNTPILWGNMAEASEAEKAKKAAAKKVVDKAVANIGESEGWWNPSRKSATEPEAEAEAQPNEKKTKKAAKKAPTEAQPNEKTTKKAAKKAPTEAAKNNLKKLLKDGPDLSQVYELFNELITLLNTDGIPHNNILELKNKDNNNTLFQLKKPIIIDKPFSNTKPKEKCTFKTLFDILTDNRNKDNICTSVNLTNLQTSVYHFSQLINNFHKYIDDNYIKIENGNIVITDANKIVNYFNKQQLESSNANLKHIYTVLSKNINFSLNTTMINILFKPRMFVPLKTFFNTVINTKYFTLLQADNDIYKLYNSVITHKRNTKQQNKTKHFKYLYSIVDLINENDNIKNSIINKYNSPSEPRRPESTRSAEPEATRSARREYVPLNTDTKKKLKKKIAFVNI